VEVRADGAADAAAFEPALAVVAEAGKDPTERLGTRVEEGPAGVVLEARQRVPLPGLELALEQYVADHPLGSRDRVQREQADPRELGSSQVAVRASEQLVAAADREHRGSAGRSLEHTVALPRQILGHERLLAVLAAADVEEVVLAGNDRLTERNRAHLDVVSPPRGATDEDGDVAAVGVDVQVVRIEMPDRDLHAARSQ
jgi:hypothetical protein